jgi:hypothetical protein
MADFRTDTSAIKVEPNKGMSLADMLNIQKSSYELSKIKELYPAMISEQQARSRTAQVGANVAEQTQQPQIESAQTQLNTQKLTNLTAHSNATISGIQKLFNKQNLTAQDVVKEATELNRIHGGSPQALEKTLQGIPADGSQTDLKAWLAQQLAQTTGSLSQLEKQYPAGILPGQLPQTTQAEPQAPAQTQAPAQVPTGVTPQAMNLPEHSQPVKTPYPVRNPNSPYLPMPSEEADKVSGIKYRDNLITRQTNLSTDKRNIDEVISKARELEQSATLPTGGVLGSLERKASTFLGTEQGIRYKELSKDLANTQMANIVAQGGSLDTVEGLRLKRLANGDETYPPKVLIGIAQRTKADITNLDMQATAAKKFSDRFGDNNMNKFKQEWAKNSDSKIFQIMNLAEDGNMSSAEKQKETEKLLGPVGSKERKTAEQKYRNLIKLQQTGSLE